MSDNGAPRFTGGGWVLPGGTDDTLIIDAYYHTFPRLGSQPEGIPPALRLKFWQYHSREWIDFWRTDTGEHVGERLLEFGSHSIDDMPDVGFRLTDHGQAEITVDGVTCRMQIYPPSLTNNEATPERMVGEPALPVFWFLDDRALDRVGRFMRRVAQLDEWTRRHPDVPCVITHGLVPTAEKALILGGNAVRLFGLERSAPRS